MAKAIKVNCSGGMPAPAVLRAHTCEVIGHWCNWGNALKILKGQWHLVLPVKSGTLGVVGIY